MALAVNKANACCWNRDYEKLLAISFLLITFVVAESDDSEWMRRGLYFLLNNGA